VREDKRVWESILIFLNFVLFHKIEKGLVDKMPKKNQGLKIGSKIPDFSLKDSNGNTFSTSNKLGKPILFYFLRGTW
jgi:cytochrome oxidase Cu insertion factor (SCO1/SenC/PrrC family)